MNVKYIFPFPKKIKVKISKPKGYYSHEKYDFSRYAVDFLMPIGTPILAAREGNVIRKEDKFSKGGLDLKYADKVNFVVVDHGDNTFAEYLHFGKKKIKVKVGDKVKSGDLLGYSGLSGCMDLPHLHFNLLKASKGKYISIPVKFSQ